MADERFEEHLRHPHGRGEIPAGAHDGSAGGAACGDLVRIGVRLDGDRVAAVGFEASGCGALTAAASAAAGLVDGAALLDAARIGAPAIADALGGLSPGKLHAADLVSDALHHALGGAARAEASLAPSPDRTLVAMSGGVDSAVAALLCAQEPRAEVCAVTLELWRDPEHDAEASCCSASAVRTARALAHRMGLPHLTIDLRDAFRAGVVEPYLADHAAGRTPNPCVRCNGHVRIDAMVELADRLGAAQLATGHYARVRDGLLALAADPAKDQTYMLAALSPQTITRLRFPLGDLVKPEVRAIAAQADLPVARAPESQDLCFLAGVGKARFLERHGALRDRDGAIVDTAGRQVGRHRGHQHFTVGQRKGLGVSVPDEAGRPEPLFVVSTDPASNTVTVGPRAALQTTRVALRGLTLHTLPEAVDAVKLRYRQRARPARLDGDVVVLEQGVDGAAPGQAAVLLAGDRIAGHAWIAGARVPATA
jgi:tRNA-specific 2-thiouridylase